MTFDKAKIAKIAGWLAMFLVGGLGATGVLPAATAAQITTGIALLLPSLIGKKAPQ